MTKQLLVRDISLSLQSGEVKCSLVSAIKSSIFKIRNYVHLGQFHYTV